MKARCSAGLVLVCAAVCGQATAQTRLPVFPGAQGFGTTTAAGRGGTVYRVTNLQDSGAGSLRAALAAAGPRVIVFEVSGTIALASVLAVTNPYVTIAGQTAPSPGITLRGATLRIQTHDVLLQHLRLRIGDEEVVSNPDALWIKDGAYNVVVDHCSLSWAIDELIGVNSSNTALAPYDITVSNSILSEALSYSVNTKGEHSKGVLIYVNTVRPGGAGITFHRNLLAHNRERGPSNRGGWRTMWVNNLTYNPGHYRGFSFYNVQNPPAAGESTMVHRITHVGNVALPGADTPAGTKSITLSNLVAGSAVYLADNSGFGLSSANQWGGVTIFGTTTRAQMEVSSPPAMVSPFTILPATQVEAHVLANAGARPADRDSVDTRVVTSVKNRTGRIIDSQQEVGGWPALAVNRRVLTLPADPNGDADGDGYTNLEEWLHAAAAAVEGVAATPIPPPPAPANLKLTN